MTKTLKRKTGDLGEELAARFLMKRGFRIVDRNYLKPWGEIDLIAQNNNTYHFIEVKTAQSNISRETLQKISRETNIVKKEEVVTRVTGLRPEENVHKQKLERLYRAIATYLTEKKVSHETEWQLDVVTVLLDTESKKALINMLENV